MMKVIISDCPEDDSHTGAMYLNEEVLQFQRRCVKREILLPNFFKNESYDELDTYMQARHASIIQKLAGIYDEMSGSSEQLSYWLVIAGYFVHRYLYFLYPKYSYITGVEDSVQFHCREYDRGVYFPDAVTFLDHLLGVPEFHEHVYSQIISCLGRRNTGHGQDIKLNTAGIQTTGKTVPAMLARNLIYCLPFSKAYQICLNGLGCDLAVPKLEKSAFYDGLAERPRDDGVRNRIAQLSAEDQFEEVVLKTIAVNMPASLLEQIPHYINSAKKLLEANRIEKIVTGQGLLYDQSFGCLVAEARKQGASFYMACHGGVANDYVEPEKWYEVQASDEYITLGGDDSVGPKLGLTIRIIPRFRLKALLPWKRFPVLTIGTEESPNITRIISQLFGYRMYDYIRFKIELLARLKSHYGSRVYHRGYHRPTWAWDVDNKIDEQVTGINHIGGKGHIFDQIAQSELVIFDYLGPTSLRDTLRMNVPTMVVFDPACHEMNPEFLPWFNKLRSAGIYHSDLDSMESELRDIARLGSARRWWNEQARLAVVEEFKREFNLLGCGIWSWRRFLTGRQGANVNS